MKTVEATFAMGCFWNPDILFSKQEGVIDTEVGYMGGDEKHYHNPSYKQVCSDATGHAEVVHVKYDPAKIHYRRLLEIFWSNHNPTTMNKQGPDVGSQYRSAIFYHDAEQKKLAEQSKKEQQKRWDRPIVTQIVPAGSFFKAEAYHQKYLLKHGGVC